MKTNETHKRHVVASCSPGQTKQNNTNKKFLNSYFCSFVFASQTKHRKQKHIHITQYNYIEEQKVPIDKQESFSP